MPNSDIAKTKLVHKPGRIIVIIGLAVVLFAVVFIFLRPAEGTQAVIGRQTYRLETVQDQASRERGLSGRAGLGKRQGMLFIFERSDRACMWMKDMQFAIDMVWLDENKRVVHLKADALPSSYPESFCPPDLAQYVIELPAGSIVRDKIAQGTLAQW